MKISTTIEIDSAHKLNLPYKSKCNNLHGHRWKINIEIEGDPMPNGAGMVIDFHKIKEYFSKYDHCFLNDVLQMETTAENLSFHFATDIKAIQSNIKRVKISVYETPKNMAECEL